MQRTFLFDMVHPADLHFFAPMIAEVERRGDLVVVTTRAKDVLIELADEAGLDHEVLSSAGQRSRLREASELFTRVRKLCVLIRRHRVDLVMSRNPSGTMAARLMRVPSMYDTDDGPAVGVLYWAAAIPATTITSPAAGGVDYGRKHLAYDGFKETASLRPERFRPDPEAVREVGLDPNVPYSVVRAVAMEASHDHGEDGLDDETLRKVVALLAPRGRVWVSSERPLPPDLEELRLPKMGAAFRHVIGCAQLLVGDSQTTAAEAAILGVPSLRLSSWAGRLPYLVELERLGLTSAFPPERRGDFLTRLGELSDNLPAAQAALLKRRDALLANTVDVTDWMIERMYELVDTT